MNEESGALEQSSLPVERRRRLVGESRAACAYAQAERKGAPVGGSARRLYDVRCEEALTRVTPNYPEPLGRRSTRPGRLSEV